MKRLSLVCAILSTSSCFAGEDPNLTNIRKNVVELKQKMLSPDPEVVKKAAASISVTATHLDILVRELENGLDHEDESVRLACLRSLSSFQYSAYPVYPKLLKMLDSSQSPEVMARVIGCMIAMYPLSKDAMPKIIAMHTARERPIKMAVIGALHKMGPSHPDAAKHVLLLAAFLNDPDSPVDKKETSVSTRATLALRDFGPQAKAAAARLKDVVQSNKGPLVSQTAALGALAKIDPRDEDLVPYLIALLQDKTRKDLWPGVLYAFGEIGAPAFKAVPHMIRLLDTKDLDDAIFEMKIKTAALQSLARMGPPAKEALPSLRQIANSTNYPENLRSFAKDAIRKLEKQ